MEPTILFEDESLLVIDKPFNMVVNRSDTTAHMRTVQDWVTEKLKIKSEKLNVDEEGNDFYNRAGIVHRIDKETSGILLIAKDPESFQNLQLQFKERTVQKKYRALVHGKVTPKTGEIHIPVGRLPWNRKQFGVVAGGKDAVSFYSVIDYFEWNSKPKEIVSFLSVEPKTGRTHQIRVHMKYLGYPIVADFLYAGRKTSIKDRKVLNRVFLHAAEIAFRHPRTQEEIHIKSNLPQELEDFMKQQLVKIT